MNAPVKKYLKKTFVSFSKYFGVVIVAGLLAVYLLTGFYKVSENELGVLQRFGKVIDGSVEPGAHYKLPWPVDTVNTTRAVSSAGGAVRKLPSSDWPGALSSELRDSTRTSYAVAGVRSVSKNCRVKSRCASALAQSVAVHDCAPRGR